MTEAPGSPRLLWLRAGEPREFALDGDALHVGREDVELLVDEPLVSRRHARLELRADGWYVVDLDSTNRTRVNGAVVTEARLADGDEIRFGRAVCHFLAAGSTLRSSTPAPADAEPTAEATTQQ